MHMRELSYSAVRERQGQYWRNSGLSPVMSSERKYYNEVCNVRTIERTRKLASQVKN